MRSSLGLLAAALLALAVHPASSRQTTVSQPVEPKTRLQQVIEAQAPKPQPVPAPRDPVSPYAEVDGQARADYDSWLVRNPAERAEVASFTQYLETEGVNGVVPTWQLLRTASMWDECDGPRFEVAPQDDWQHIAESLKFIRGNVIPAIGPVEAVSGYRNGELNRCARGAPKSAHRHFYALDLVPVRHIGRAGLVRSLCAAHHSHGEAYDTGLGFYSGVRFHIDSKGYRRWGPDGSGATSPCVTEV